MTQTLMQRLLATQAALKAPKGQENKFGGYRYRSCEDILEAVKPLLKDNGLLLLVTDEPVVIGNRTYIKATATVCDALADTYAEFSVTAYAREANEKKGMDEAQITGSASSYARKYALNGMFLIDDTKDPDATNDHGKGQQKQKQDGIDKSGAIARCRKLKADAIQLGISEDGINGWLRANNLDKKPSSMAPHELKAFEEYLAGMIRDKKSLDAA